MSGRPPWEGRELSPAQVLATPEYRAEVAARDRVLERMQSGPRRDACEACREAPPLPEPAPCLTAYAGELEHLNRRPWLCGPCTEDHVEYWEDRWAEHDAGRL